jgi:tRNA modification GTPase
MKDDTIYALATGGGRAGLAVVRISGPRAGAALGRLIGRDLPEPRRATRVTIRDQCQVIDEGLALWFPGPASFTGEDVAELHLHGGRAVSAAVLAALGSQPGLRLANPGEFTRRAFEHGKMDLTAAEGLADLVAAETEAQRRQALRQMQGELGRIYESWRGRLLTALAHIEATIDFSDQDLPEGLDDGVRREIADLRTEIEAHLQDNRRGERLRDGIHIAIVGAPNVGKSSLLNLLARRDAAIVSDIAGTTRDVIEVHLDLAGLPVVVADTAGLRDTQDRIEVEGVRRAQRTAEDADLKIAVFDAMDWPKVDPVMAGLVDERTLPVVNKIDLRTLTEPLEIRGQKAFAISVKTGAGVEGLLQALGYEASRRFGDLGSPALTRARHREALTDCVSSLARFNGAKAPELAAEDLRLAARALGRITGRVDVEDVLDVIFREFCIGK